MLGTEVRLVRAEVAGKDRLDFRIWAVPAAARPALRLALLGDW